MVVVEAEHSGSHWSQGRGGMTPVPAWSIPEARLYTGDAIETLAGLPAESFDCVVTSPPYYGLRDYGTGRWVGGDPTCPHTARAAHTTPPTTHPAGNHPAATDRGDPRRCGACGARREDRQYGLEPTPEAYVDTLRAVFVEIHRTLLPTGTVWLNLGDCYSAEPPGRATNARSSTLAGWQAAATTRELVRSANVDRTRFLPRKNLLGMPWRVVLALQADGWLVRNALVWSKTNPMPESVKDRLSTTYEFVFLLAKQLHYYFDLDAIRVPLARPQALTEGLVIGGANKGGHADVGATARRRGHSVYGAKYSDAQPFRRGRHGSALRPGTRHDARHPRGKNPGDVWRLPTRPLREAHFAAFPLDLPLRAIAAGCPPGGVVADPFSGAATTGVAALQLGRRYVGIDLHPNHTAIGVRRLCQTRHPD